MTLSLSQYEQILRAAAREPSWRVEADRCANYYDGKQIDAEMAETLRERGLGNLVSNGIKPVVNALLGNEAKTRANWRVLPDDDGQMTAPAPGGGQDSTAVAEALSHRLSIAERESRADQAISDAYAGQVKAGLGFVEVSRNPDPLEYPYRVETVHRNEIWWDWSAKKPDLSDAAWLIRQRWYPTEQVCLIFKTQADFIRAAAAGSPEAALELYRADGSLPGAAGAPSRVGATNDDWRREDGSEVLIREVWYRTIEEKSTLVLPSGKSVLFDPENPLHALAAERGIARPEKAVVSSYRVSLWIGPHCLQDAAGKRFPYVPFWGYREDLTGIPYGVVRDMIPMQDEVNARRRMLLWLLSSKRVFAYSDALDKTYNDFSDVAREINRPDAFVILDPDSKSGQPVRVESDLSLSAQQFQVMQESEAAIQKAAGMFNSALGRSDTAKSGVAVNSLIEQSMTTAAEINDNYRHSRRLVGERLLDLMIEDMTRDNIEIAYGDDGRKRVTLNRPTQDFPTGVPYRENDVTRLDLKVALSEVPETVTFREQQFNQISEVMKSLPGNLQAILVPFYLEASNFPRRKEMADLVRKSLGQSGSDPQPDPEKTAMAERIREMQQLLQRGKAEYDAKIADLQKALSDKSAETQRKAMETDAETALRVAQADKLQAETQAARVELLQQARSIR